MRFQEGNKLRFVELFAGIGGVRLGLERSQTVSKFEGEQGNDRGELHFGQLQQADAKRQLDRNDKNESSQYDDRQFSCVWANDWDKYASKVYRRHWDDGTLTEGDIKAIPVDSIPDHDLLTAGFPCQSFSIAGKRRGIEEARGTLFYEIARVAEAKRPKLLLLENVRGLLSSRNGKDFALILQVLGDLGYVLEWQVLNSKHFGVPQNRERVFIVGHLGETGCRTVFPVGEDDGEVDEDGATVRTLQGGGHSGGLHSRMTAIMNLPHGYNNGFVKPLPSLGSDSGSQYNELLVQPVLTPDREKKRQHGRRFKEGGEEMFTLTGQDIHGIAYPEVANTVCDGWLMDTKHHDKPMNQYRIRRLTPVECERLQGFPDGFTRGVSDSQRYKLLGNAVTVNVIRFLGGLLSEANAD